MTAWEWWHVQSPPGTYLATFRERIQAIAWAAANIAAGQTWVLVKWTVASAIDSAYTGPPTAPPNVPAVEPLASPLPSEVHALPGQGAIPASP